MIIIIIMISCLPSCLPGNPCCPWPPWPAWPILGLRAIYGRKVTQQKSLKTTVSFHNFKSQNFKLSVSNPICEAAEALAPDACTNYYYYYYYYYRHHHYYHDYYYYYYYHRLLLLLLLPDLA